jgi:hypothetical protein
MLYVAQTATENIQVINFNFEIVHHLAAIKQFEQGG